MYFGFQLQFNIAVWLSTFRESFFFPATDGSTPIVITKGGLSYGPALILPELHSLLLLIMMKHSTFFYHFLSILGKSFGIA